MKHHFTINHLLGLAILLMPVISKAQDILVKTDSSKTQVTIRELNPKEIKYKLYTYADGPMITVNKADVAYIIYQNGMREVITTPVNQTTKVKQETEFNLDRFNDPRLPGPDQLPYRVMDRDYEKLYEGKNYIGFNYLAFMNSCVGFNYMRDFRKQHILINVPLGIGIGTPYLSNGLYRGNYLGGSEVQAYYTWLKFQAGVNLLFSPAMNRAVNFLIGPSFMYTSYNVKVDAKYNYYNGSSHVISFKNTFELHRKVYGMSVGFLARMGPHINMNVLLTLGVKDDGYNKKDPYGHDYAVSMGYTGSFNYTYTGMPYAGFACSIGYRF